ncbi:MAG: hypothetical protein AVDCRST_MAG59-2041 [uncultured Thermomicrobiales bacterium]|uniref:Uncharacterized protein n=1 Tax=uncultured Thermomicrobiales bacterium TaxID=1645740 RepID=A0A6J4UPX6_9BACT|nr:MAG: hypothetical protein AVDCRST_MAG59-2041 [uncultured Thermomicrobiales bacterium]
MADQIREDLGQAVGVPSPNRRPVGRVGRDDRGPPRRPGEVDRPAAQLQPGHVRQPVDQAGIRSAWATMPATAVSPYPPRSASAGRAGGQRSAASAVRRWPPPGGRARPPPGADAAGGRGDPSGGRGGPRPCRLGHAGRKPAATTGA